VVGGRGGSAEVDGRGARAGGGNTQEWRGCRRLRFDFVALRGF
jgi:hypothetical protein